MPDIIRLLVIEDNQDDRDFIGAAFGSEISLPVILSFAGDMAKAKVLLGSNKYDAILLDWILPDSASGVLSITLIRAFDAFVPLIILTALDDIEANKAAIEAGADGYLIKPALPANIVHALYSAILRKQIRDERVMGVLSGIIGSLDNAAGSLKTVASEEK